MLGITNAELKNDYIVYVEFNDGLNGVIDFKNEMENDHREIVRELLNPEQFKTMKIGRHILCRDNDVDFAPEFLYDMMKVQRKKAAQIFLKMPDKFWRVFYTVLNEIIRLNGLDRRFDRPQKNEVVNGL